MKVLIIGAGAVGQVYGRHLGFSGAEVSFLVKEKYRKEMEAGLVFYGFNGASGRPEVQNWTGYEVLSRLDEVREQRWDQVWFCVSSTAIRGEWLGLTLKECGEATIVALQPGLEDRELYLKHVDSKRLVSGMIGFISYQAPLEVEHFPHKGIAYWFPPLSPSLFSGTGDHLKEVLGALKAGGLPAKGHPELEKVVGFPTAVLMPILVGLESEGWDFDRFSRSGVRDLVCRAANEALKIVGAKTGSKVPLGRILIKPWTIRCLVALAPSVMPLPIEAYLQYHFTKVGDQTRLFIDTYRRMGESYKLSYTALDELRSLIK